MLRSGGHSVGAELAREGPYLTHRVGPIAGKPCSYAILGDQVLMISDAANDLRFHDNPLVTGAPHIRFYAGCPLRVSNGSKVGTLCLIDTRPRVLDDDEKALLKDLASMAEQEIEALRDMDIIGRVGGDEFVLLLMATSASESKLILQRLQTALKTHAQLAGRGYEIRYSVGQIEYDPARHDSVKRLLADADARMYANKRRG